MNKQTKISLVIIGVILLLVCVRVLVTDLPREMQQMEIIPFRAETIKTHIYMEDFQSPGINCVNTMQELYNYSNVFSEYNLDEKLDGYGDSFFKENSLIIITLQEGSGSITNTVSDIKRVNKSTIDITVNRKTPQVGTMDMAMNHVIIEVNKLDIRNITNILINGK